MELKSLDTSISTERVCNGTCICPELFSTQRFIQDEISLIRYSLWSKQLLSEVYSCWHACTTGTKILECEFHPEDFGRTAVVVCCYSMKAGLALKAGQKL